MSSTRLSIINLHVYMKLVNDYQIIPMVIYFLASAPVFAPSEAPETTEETYSAASETLALAASTYSRAVSE